MATAAVFGVMNAEITVDQVFEPTKLPECFAAATRYRIRFRGMQGDELTFVAICEHGRTGMKGEIMCNPFSMAVDARKTVAAGKSLDTVVKADWLEEHGFPEAAAKLRTFDDGF